MVVDYNSIFGVNLGKLIEQKKWSDQKAAEELGYSRKELSLVITGQQNFKMKTAVKFARYFNVSLHLFFTRVFDNDEYRAHFPFVEADYMSVLGQNFRDLSIKQASIDMDKSSLSQILNARRRSITIETATKLAEEAGVSLADLLMTVEDKEIKKKLEEDRR